MSPVHNPNLPIRNHKACQRPAASYAQSLFSVWQHRIPNLGSALALCSIKHIIVSLKSFDITRLTKKFKPIIPEYKINPSHNEIKILLNSQNQSFVAATLVPHPPATRALLVLKNVLEFPLQARDLTSGSSVQGCPRLEGCIPTSGGG